MKDTMAASIRTDNLNVREMALLVTPMELKQECPASSEGLRNVSRARAMIRRILSGTDECAGWEATERMLRRAAKDLAAMVQPAGASVAP